MCSEEIIYNHSSVCIPTDLCECECVHTTTSESNGIIQHPLKKNAFYDLFYQFHHNCANNKLFSKGDAFQFSSLSPIFFLNANLNASVVKDDCLLVYGGTGGSSMLKRPSERPRGSIYG